MRVGDTKQALRGIALGGNKVDKEKVKKFLCCAIAVITMITPFCGVQGFAEEYYDEYFDDGGLYGEASDDEEEEQDSDTDKAEEVSEENSVSSVAELDKLAYNGDDLGATYTKGATTFKVWSPTAERVQVLIYATGSDEEEDSKYISANEMSYDEKSGVWSATVQGDLLNKYYRYNVYTGKKGK